MKTAQRRQNLKESLIAAAETAIAERGLAALKARDLAAAAGCALGAIYNVVEDLDDLVLMVNARTLVALEAALGAAPQGARRPVPGPAQRLRDMALRYLDFAAGNLLRWRALFDHRMTAGRTVPDWYLAELQRVFAPLERTLQELRPGISEAESGVLARTLFSAVHGIVVLGLEERLGVVPRDVLRAQLTLVVSATTDGLARRA